MDSTSWEIHSDTKSSAFLALAIGLAGALLMYWTKAQAGQTENALAAFWLGAILAAIGTSVFITLEEVRVTIDPRERRLTFDRKFYWGWDQSSYDFREIDSVGVVKIGSRSPSSYFLNVNIKNGKTERTGRWSFDKSEIEELAQRLAADIACDVRSGPNVMPLSTKHVIGSGIGSLIAYSLWFRLAIGPWCPAMWHGTAPPLLMLCAFGVFLGISRRLWR